MTNVTYNAITTDFWGNLDAISGKEYWQQFGVGGDAKGQPTQSQSVSHGAPWVRIRKIMVGRRVPIGQARQARLRAQPEPDPGQLAETLWHITRQFIKTVGVAGVARRLARSDRRTCSRSRRPAR